MVGVGKESIRHKTACTVERNLATRRDLPNIGGWFRHARSFGSETCCLYRPVHAGLQKSGVSTAERY